MKKGFAFLILAIAQLNGGSCFTEKGLPPKNPEICKPEPCLEPCKSEPCLEPCKPEPCKPVICPPEPCKPEPPCKIEEPCCKRCAFDVSAELLLFTTSINSVTTDAQILLNQAFGNANALTVFNNTRSTVNPSYTPGFSVALTYTPTKNGNSIGLFYSFINTDGANKYSKQDTATSGDLVQLLVQNNFGQQWVDLHLLGLLVNKFVPVDHLFSIGFSGGFVFHQFVYKSKFRNNLDLTQNNTDGSFNASQVVDVKVRVGGGFWGIGPTIGMAWDFAFVSRKKHKLDIVSELQFSLLSAIEKVKTSLDLSSTVDSMSTGIVQSTTQVKQKILPTDVFIPNADMDFSFRYHNICFPKCPMTFAFGYRILSYFLVDQLGKHDTLLEQFSDFALENIAIFPLDIDNFSFSGPYFRFTFGF